MTDKMLAVGQAVTRFLIESFDQDYLSFVFSEEMGIDELVDQVLLELSKYAFDETQEKHSIRYYLNQQGNYNEDVRKRYSRLIKISNKYKEKEISFFETNFGMFGDDNRPPQMDEMDDRLEGYHLSPMNFYEITNIGDLELIKAIINHRMGSTKKVSNTRFKEIALQYDKFVLSLREQCQDSDEKMVFNSLAYFTLEWKYAFDFIYSCAESMEQKGITDAIDIFSKVGILIGYIATDSILGITASADSRMVGYREKMIPSFIEAPALSRRYIEILTLMCMVKEKACINDIPIKKWFIDNTDVHDWASFFKDYDVFRLTRAGLL